GVSSCPRPKPSRGPGRTPARTSVPGTRLPGSTSSTACRCWPARSIDCSSSSTTCSPRGTGASGAGRRDSTPGNRSGPIDLGALSEVAASVRAMRSLEDVLDQFAYHPATEDTAPRHDAIRSAFLAFAEQLWPLVPDGPEKT